MVVNGILTAMQENPKELFEQGEWAQAGKLLLAISGLACLSLAVYQGDGALAWFLRSYVGVFGLSAVVIALRDFRPS